jgi:hypothetical protein
MQELKATMPGMKSPPSIQVGRVRLIQTGSGELLLTYKKGPDSAEITFPISAAQLEKWAVRQMREGVFAEPQR